MQTTECVERVQQREGKSRAREHCFNSDMRKQKKRKGSTATARLKRQAGGGGGRGHAGDPALHESLFINVLLGSIKDFEGDYLLLFMSY